MKSSSLSSFRKVAGRTAIAVAALAACSAASALSSFTFNPGAVAGLSGAAYTADNLIVADYGTVTYTTTGFTEHGFLQVTSAQLGSTVVSSNPGLYIEFNATGTNIIPAGGAFQFGTLDLTYTLYGYTGVGMFTPTAATTSSKVVLGTGSTIAGSSNTFSGTSMGTTVTGANATLNALTFAVAPTASAFFASPSPFYTMVQAQFGNTSDKISSSGTTGFTVSGGGGSVNFVAAAVPEPETYALMLGGLAAVGFVARRRSNG